MPSSPRSAPSVFLVATVADQLSVQYPEHVRQLLDLDVELHVFASSHPDYLLDREDIHCHVIPISRLLDARGAVHAAAILMREARRWRPALILYGSPSAGLVGSMASRFLVPHRVLVVHGLREETLRGVRRLAAVTAGRLSARLSTLVVFVSPSVRTRSGYASRSDTCRSVVAPGGFVGARLPPRGEKERCDEALHKGATTVGFVGRLARDKGIEELVAAVATLRRDRPDLRLLLVGSEDDTDPPSESVLRAIQRDARTTWTGQVEDATAYFVDMDVLCLPSYREGLPTVVLEAMAHGLPVVGSDATGMCDLLTSATGWPCPPGSDESLAAALRDALANPDERRRRARTAHDLVRERYRTETVMRWWRERYEGLLGLKVTSPVDPEAAPALDARRAAADPTR